MGNPMEKCDYAFEYLIVGAGPAGCQAAYFLEKSGRRYAVLEAGKGPGTFFEKYPRHRQLISINKRFNGFPEADYNLRHDWNSLISDDPEMRMTKYTDKLFPHANTLVKFLNDYVKKFNLNIKYNSKVQKIRREKHHDGSDGDFLVRTEAGEVFRTKVLLMACGAMVEKVPDIPGAELATTYAGHSIRREDYEDHRVCVVGGGNSGFETADHLVGHAAIVHVLNDTKVLFAWDTHFPGHLRAINNNLIDMFHLKSLHAVRVGKIQKIEEVFVDGKRKLKLSYDMPLPHWNPPTTCHLDALYDDVILCCGWNYIVPEMYEDNCLPEMSDCGKYAVLKPNWESTNVSNMYFLGTATQQRDRRAASSFIHGFRYSVRCLTTLLNYERHNVPWPMTTMNIKLEDVAEFMIKRFSTTSALYQLNYGVLCDVMVFDPGFARECSTLPDDHIIPGVVNYYYELPTEWALQQKLLKDKDSYWVVILKDHRASFPSKMPVMDFSAPPDLMVSNQGCSGFIGPMILRYEGGRMVEEYNLGGNLIVRADQPQLPGDNNPQLNKNKLMNLICKQLGVRGACFDESFIDREKYEAMFTPWSKEEIQKARMEEDMMTDAKPCKFKVNMNPIVNS